MTNLLISDDQYLEQSPYLIDSLNSAECPIKLYRKDYYDENYDSLNISKAFEFSLQKIEDDKFQNLQKTLKGWGEATNQLYKTMERVSEVYTIGTKGCRESILDQCTSVFVFDIEFSVFVRITLGDVAEWDNEEIPIMQHDGDK